MSQQFPSTVGLRGQTQATRLGDQCRCHLSYWQPSVLTVYTFSYLLSLCVLSRSICFQDSLVLSFDCVCLAHAGAPVFYLCSFLTAFPLIITVGDFSSKFYFVSIFDAFPEYVSHGYIQLQLYWMVCIVQLAVLCWGICTPHICDDHGLTLWNCRRAPN